MASSTCQTLRSDDYTYVAMNADGCWCDNTFHEKTGDGITIGDETCLMDAAAADAKECEFGPCGGDAFHTAVYRLKSTGYALYSSPEGNSFVAYDIDLSVYFDATWGFRGLGYGMDGALQVKNQTGETVVSITAAEARAVAAAQAAQAGAGLGAGAAKRASRSSKGLGGVVRVVKPALWNAPPDLFSA